MINFTHTPPKFTPVYTDGLFYTVSADTNYFKFRYVYSISVNGATIFTGKATPNPFGLGVIDVSRILRTYVKNNPISYWNTTPIYTHQTFPFSRPSEAETINYQLYVGYEYASSDIAPVTGFTGNGNDVGLPAETDGLYKTFQSTMGVNGRANQQNFDMGPFVLSGTPTGTYPTTSGLFLTNSPRIRDIQESEYYTLGFTNYYLDNNTMLSEPYYVQYKFYDDQGTLLDTQNYNNHLSNGGGPLDTCSLVYPSSYLLIPKSETAFNTLYVGAGPMNLQDVIPADTAQYTVQLFGRFQGETVPVTPTPVPTPSPTPTPVPCSGECQSVSVTNYGPVECLVEYLDCNTNSTFSVFVPSNTSMLLDCICPTSISSPCRLEIALSGPCPPFQPCRDCYQLIVVNNSAEARCNFDYYNCNTQEWTRTYLEPETGQSYACACPDIISDCGDLEVTLVDICSPGPTPTPTPTPTPLPLYYFYMGTVTVYGSSASACTNRTCARPFYTTQTALIIGNRLYDDSALTIPYFGSGWIAVNRNCSTTWELIQVNSAGYIINTASPCP